ncbi:CD1375 family protein [Enterococcus faecium]|nr:CD1375 family protein [Enterococcus faecium]
MEKVYVDLIKKGKKTIEDVPKKLKKKVQEILAKEEAKEILTE